MTGKEFSMQIPLPSPEMIDAVEDIVKSEYAQDQARIFFEGVIDMKDATSGIFTGVTRVNNDAVSKHAGVFIYAEDPELSKSPLSYKSVILWPCETESRLSSEVYVLLDTEESIELSYFNLKKKHFVPNDRRLKRESYNNIMADLFNELVNNAHQNLGERIKARIMLDKLGDLPFSEDFEEILQ